MLPSLPFCMSAMWSVETFTSNSLQTFYLSFLLKAPTRAIRALSSTSGCITRSGRRRRTSSSKTRSDSRTNFSRDFFRRRSAPTGAISVHHPGPPACRARSSSRRFRFVAALSVAPRRALLGHCRAAQCSSEPPASDRISAGTLVVGPLSDEPLSAGLLSARPLSAGPLSVGSLIAGPLSAGPLSADRLSAAPLSAAPLSTATLSAAPLCVEPLRSRLRLPAAAAVLFSSSTSSLTACMQITSSPSNSAI